jgi:FkbM family methyltransferase
LIFPNASLIAKLGPSLSTFKMLLMAAGTSRPYLRGFSLTLLRPFIRNGQIAVHYRCEGRRYKVWVRVADFESDWQTVNEMAVQRIYPVDVGFSPDLIIDGGGNTGLFTLYAAAVYPSAQVVACEPVPRNLAQIEKHLRINHVAAEVKPVCIGGSERKIPFYVREANQGSFDPGLPYSSQIDVDVVTLASLVRGWNAKRILIKLDIEGMEVEALESFVCDEKRPVLVVGEVHNAGTSVALLEQIFRRSGWTVRFGDVGAMTGNFTAWSPAAAPMLADQPVAMFS